MTEFASRAWASHTKARQIPDLVARLRASFDAGLTRPLDWRRRQLEALRALISENSESLLEALRADLRRPDVESWMTEIVFTIGEIDLARKKLGSWSKPKRVPTPAILQPGCSWLAYEPLGVVLIIAPWNYPIQLALTPLVAALAAGNAALVKPSEVTAHVSAQLARLVPRYLDPKAVSLLEGGALEAQALLAERWDHIFYTGNGRVGRIVMEAAARHLTPVTLELGGKSPCIVDRDCNLEVAARRISWAKFANAGQTCVAPDYLLVHESREQELVERIERCIEEFFGRDPQKSPDFARIVSDGHVERLARLLESGSIAVGGTVDRADRYVAPTVLRGVSPDSPAMRDEIFGPVLPVLTWRELDEAIAFVSAREKPLALYVFTERRETEEAVLSRTSAGGVCVNATLWHLANPALPFGGVGGSGMGAYHGRWGFEQMSRRKPVLKKGTWLDPDLVYPPYTRFKSAVIRRFL